MRRPYAGCWRCWRRCRHAELPARGPHLARQPAVDLRRSFDGLAEQVRQHLQADPLSGHVFVFRNKRSDRVKLLYWDEDGFVIVYKRLEEGTFHWPAGSRRSGQRDAAGGRIGHAAGRHRLARRQAVAALSPAGDAAEWQGAAWAAPLFLAFCGTFKVCHTSNRHERSRTTLASPLPTTAEHLPDDVATLQRMVLELLASLQERDRDNEALQHRLDLLLRRLYGPRGERFDPNQPLLFAEAAGQDPAPRRRTAPPAADAEPKRRCRPHGRRRLPEHLPREPRHHELPEADRLCPHCGQLRLDIGTDRSEQLDYRPASLLVIEHFVHKYVCPCCSRRPGRAQGARPLGPGVRPHAGAQPATPSQRRRASADCPAPRPADAEPAPASASPPPATKPTAATAASLARTAARW